ncbi:MAG TPA: ImmA/IrrE family metallo-endopeptidase [Polyangiaceae bacterium]|nr:ImmA/IrrE family metallo-endopeptidase [Polyangiaceae bacterium]
MAHELCRVLFDPSEGGLHLVVEGADERRGQAAEQRARAFAAELLLPFEGLSRLLGVPRALEETGAVRDLIARARSHFGTPHEIASNHLCNLNFIDRRLRERLEAETTTFAATPPTTTLPARNAPSRVVAELVARAHREGLLTDSEARSTLGLDQFDRLPWDEVEL